MRMDARSAAQPIAHAIGKPCDKADTAWRGQRTGKLLDDTP